MKSSISKVKFVLLIVLTVLSYSCSSEDGADGADGAPGLQGPQGPAGVDGNANVTTVVIRGATLSLGVNEVEVPELTQDIFENGLVFAYITQEPTIWFSLPFTEEQNIGTEEDPVLVSVVVVKMIGKEVGKVVLASLLEGDVDLKFVLVEGDLAAKQSFNAKDFLD